jgi:predicted nucleic acid-binding protein
MLVSETFNSDFTPKQRDIIHAAAGDRNRSNQQIADIVGCSVSYARRVLNRNSEAVERVNTLSDISYLPCFSQPYSIIFSSEEFEEYVLEPGDVVKLLGEYEGKFGDTYATVEEISQSIWQQELRARVHGVYHTAGQLRSEYELLPDDVRVLDDGRADPSTDAQFRELIQKVRRTFEEGENIQALIGVGVLEVINGQREPNDLLTTGEFNLEPEYFCKYLCGETPDWTEIQRVIEPVPSPEKVFFTYYNEDLSKEEINQFREQILSQQYFKSTWNYALPNAPSLVGPTSTDRNEDLIQIESDSLELIPGVQVPVQFVYDGDIVSEGLDTETIHTAIKEANPQFNFESTRGDSETNLPLRTDENNVFFLFDQVTLVLHPKGDHIVWSRPEGVEALDTLVSAVNEMIAAQLGFDDVLTGEIQYPQQERISESDWVVDTNTLYHDHIADQPTTILHTILSHTFFQDSTIHIPWAVLFEFNKHADRGEGTNPKNRQGFENVKMLKQLQWLDFLSVEIQSAPEKLHPELSIGDIADLYVLRHAESLDAPLITGDHTLEDLSELVDVPAINVKQLKTLTAPIGNTEPKEEVLPEIGLSLHEEKEIIKAISELLNSDSTVPIPESSRIVSDNPDSILGGWINNGDVTKYRNQEYENTLYAKQCDLSVVGSISALRRLADCIKDGKLTDACRKKLTENYSCPINNDEFPQIQLIVPKEYVIAHATDKGEPEEFSKTLLTLKQCDNIDYQTMSAFSADTNLRPDTISLPADEDERPDEHLISQSDYRAVALASAQEERILLTDASEEGLWKFNQLLGIKAMRL